MKQGLILICFLLILSCASNQEEKNEQLISEDQLVELMIDFQIAETFIASFPGANDSLTRLTQDYYASILQKHQVQKEDFLLSLEYYSKNPIAFNVVLSRVVDSLSFRLATVEGTALIEQ